jgi:hypothetical protein
MELKIDTNADGMKFWNEAQKRHIQEGPDVLIISTKKNNLNFKTTFTPGPGAGQDIQCIIAGEIMTLVGMDMKPEEWRAFVAGRTTRNARIKEKSATEKYIEKTLKIQKAASEKARLAYEKTGDPEMVIEYIKKSKSGAALHEPWINAAIQRFIRNDRSDLLKKAFLPRRGENKEARHRELEDMMFFERIEKQRRAGKSLKEAWITESERTGGGISEEELRSIKNKYYRAKRIKTEITIQETADSFAMTAFPAKITQGDLVMFGEWKITFPKK